MLSGQLDLQLVSRKAIWVAYGSIARLSHWEWSHQSSYGSSGCPNQEGRPTLSGFNQLLPALCFTPHFTKLPLS